MSMRMWSKKYLGSVGVVTMLLLGTASASATPFDANSTYELTGTLGGFLENSLDADNRFDLFLNLTITGQVVSGALTGNGAIDVVNVVYTVQGGEFRNVSYDANGGIVLGDVVGVVNAGAEGAIQYTNVALVQTANGEQAAAVFTDRVDTNSQLPLGTGQGSLGLLPQSSLSGTVNGVDFSQEGVVLNGKSQLLAGSIHELDYLPFSPLGSFMASFGEHQGLGFGFHGWVMNATNSTLGLGIGAEFNTFLDFHTTLTRVDTPPPGEIPEPATMLLLGSSLLGGAQLRRRRGLVS